VVVSAPLRMLFELGVADVRRQEVGCSVAILAIWDGLENPFMAIVWSSDIILHPSSQFQRHVGYDRFPRFLYVSLFNAKPKEGLKLAGA